MAVAPPDFRTIAPTFETWPQGEPIIRVFNPAHPPNGFNPGAGGVSVRGRFHFFADPAGSAVPVLYGSNAEDGAIAETIFHDVPVHGTIRSVPESRLDEAAIVTLVAERDLVLIELHGFGLRRLRVQPADLTGTDPAEYPSTVPWAKALHAAFPHIDGLVWMSKQFNSAKALVLFGDRVRPAELTITNGPTSLRVGAGRTLVDRAANHAGIVVVA